MYLTELKSALQNFNAGTEWLYPLFCLFCIFILVSSTITLFILCFTKPLTYNEIIDWFNYE